MNNQKLSLKLGLITISIFTAFNHASADIGKVLLAVGDVNAKREQTVKLSRGDRLLEKDIVVTGEKGRAQLLMVDGAKIAVKPSSEIFLEEYQYKQADENVVGKSESSMTMSLIKGGFRTISGAIGSGEDKSDYKVKTPIATIGIRGTDYSAMICNTSCISINGSGTVNSGIYFGVSKGSIIIKNAFGELVIDKNQFGYVASADKPPIRIITPPQDLMSDTSILSPEDSIGLNIDVPETNDDGTGAGINGSDDKEITGQVNPDIVVPVDATNGDDLIRVDNNYDFSNSRSIAYSSNFNSTNGFSLVTNTPFDSLAEESRGLIGFYALSTNGIIGTEYSLHQAQSFNVGYDPVSGISWGRWSDGFIQTYADNGNIQLIDLNNSSLHWALDNNETGQALPITGGASYSLIGNTDPTNNLGQTGILGSAEFFVDFSNQLVANQINLGIGEQVWSAAGIGSIGENTNWFAGLYNSVLINGNEGGAGNFSGFFGNQLDPETGLPAGVGLVYNLFDEIQIINGTVIFGDPKP